MGYEAINFDKKFKLFDEQWSPKVIAEMNDYQFKVVRLQGDFVWHDHKDTDETFIVLEGDLRIDFRDGAVHLAAGEMFVVPKGVEHKPYAEREVKLLLIEPRGVLNTGDEGGERTAENDVWIWVGHIAANACAVIEVASLALIGTAKKRKPENGSDERLAKEPQKWDWRNHWIFDGLNVLDAFGAARAPQSAFESRRGNGRRATGKTGDKGAGGTLKRDDFRLNRLRF
jgi:mannose-6-phosphate isomerase-like protein (cupin superfamily)